MAGLDQSMSKAQLSTEMSRVERLLKEAGTFANTLYTALQKVEQTNVQKTADGLKAVGKESVDASGKVVESSTKMSAAMTKSTEAVKKAATTHANAHKAVGNSALSTGKLMDSFAGSITSVVTGYASIQTVVTAVTAAFQENARVIQEAQTSMQNYAKVSGQLGQKASTTQELGQYRAVVQQLAESGAVTDRAAEIVAQLMNNDITGKLSEIAIADPAAKRTAVVFDDVDKGQMSFFDTAKDEDILKELEELDITKLTPLDALNTLYKYQSKLKNRY